MITYRRGVLRDLRSKVQLVRPFCDTHSCGGEKFSIKRRKAFCDNSDPFDSVSASSSIWSDGYTEGARVIPGGGWIVPTRVGYVEKARQLASTLEHNDDVSLIQATTSPRHAVSSEAPESYSRDLRRVDVTIGRGGVRPCSSVVINRGKH